jgi:hypothetical protein
MTKQTEDFLESMGVIVYTLGWLVAVATMGVK